MFVLGTGGELGPGAQQGSYALNFWFSWRVFGSTGPQGTALLAMQIDWFLMRMKGFVLCFFTFMFSTTALQFKLVVHSDHPAFAVHRYFCLSKM